MRHSADIRSECVIHGHKQAMRRPTYSFDSDLRHLIGCVPPEADRLSELRLSCLCVGYLIWVLVMRGAATVAE
jgi:hypothetical protein